MARRAAAHNAPARPPASFQSELRQDTIATHVRLNIYPDGGVSRSRLFGTPTSKGRQRAVLRFFNSLDNDQFRIVMADYLRRADLDRPHVGRATLRYGGTHCLPQRTRRSTRSARDEWLEAFRHHPRIGERTAQRTQSADARASSAGEQGRVMEADAAAIARLAEANRVYEERFGHVFIVSAAGRSAPEIQALLRRPPEKRPCRGARRRGSGAATDHQATPGESAWITISTHVLDTSVGLPASDIEIRLSSLGADEAGGRRTGAAPTLTAALHV